ncbi:enoyl-CoA hydratase-related protein [Bradyrhizobium sp. WD16]|uniref:enoyl-CoA hydratase-related protein n=1 Tax=Bradyrhizobium sp. WD16 TaxID=1521768 RepID=UPI0020A5903F|nr:enoyl-CoA hydratase-related protein [Bradyrhizobium sp. WD16]UTD29241.1 enoyl-CoA hydratase [Bradyrhizobium sp. WD16]
MTESVRIARDGGLARIVLHRPERNNAFDEAMIAALAAAFETVAADDGVSTVVVSGEGRSFCAGADINWMKRAAAYGREENIRDAEPLARMLAALDRMPQTTIARVQGPVYGGGIGLVAACDIAVAAADASFCLSEVRLGLVPAVISPYVLRAIGARHGRRYFQTAEVFSATEAARIGLVHETVAAEALDDRIAALLEQLRSGAPGARAAAKALVGQVAGRAIDAGVLRHTAELIADMRAKDEAREGLAAFLEKRKPSWSQM